MIKSLKKIKKFGVFDDYNFDSTTTSEFGDINLIYGWNYSGKTTFSRIFRCLEKGALNKNYQDAEFQFIDESSVVIDQSNIGAASKVVRVFNSDFVEKNLKWSGETFDPILLLGKDSIDAKKKIQENESLITRFNSSFAEKRKKAEGVASKIKEDKRKLGNHISQEVGITSVFNASHINIIISDIEGDIDGNILDDESINVYKKTISTPEDSILPVLDKYDIDVSGLIDLQTIVSLLEKKPELSSTVEYLLENDKLEQWVEDGIHLHEDSDACLFCGNELDRTKFSEFKSHFSSDKKLHESLLDKAIEAIEISKISVDKYEPDKVNHAVRSQYQDQVNKFGVVENIYNGFLDTLIVLLNKKKIAPLQIISLEVFILSILDFLKENGLENISYEEVCTALPDMVDVSIETLNKTIQEHNDVTESFSIIKERSREELKVHFVAKFVKESGLLEDEKYVNLMNRHAEKYDLLSSKYKKRNEALEATISTAQKGREKINEYISDFLGNAELEINVTKEGEYDRFTLERNGSQALHLSEGEKTAISFSFFLAKLLELSDLSEAIIYIDDPISSLDSNHIFQVNSFIKNIFFEKTVDENGNSPWSLKCKQIFISTHNFEFFTLLCELPGKIKEGAALKKSFFHVKRLGAKKSIYIDLPKTLLNYSSEYHYLFNMIHEFYNSANKSDLDSLMVVPNALRRFLELYTYSKLPGSKNETVESRAEKIFGSIDSKHILKVCHYFSHSNNIERMLRHSDFICDIENAVKVVVEHVRDRDSLHFNALTEQT